MYVFELNSRKIVPVSPAMKATIKHLHLGAGDKLPSTWKSLHQRQDICNVCTLAIPAFEELI